MSRTFAFIGSRPDLAGLIVEAHESLLTVERAQDSTLAWGAGYFHNDEVLLKRRPDEPNSPLSLGRALAGVRTHALLAHVCDTTAGGLRTETTPPLRYGHLLFACQGPDAHHAALRSAVVATLPDFLVGSLRGDTFTELAFSLFLAALPPAMLARSRERGAKSSLPPDPAVARAALRGALARLDDICQKHDVPAFDGDLWLNTGEFLIVAHRHGSLGLRIYRGGADFGALGADPALVHNLEQTHFAVAASQIDALPTGWERLPDRHLLTASRTALPETEAL